jgi:AcrR family transcriptional regulator
MRPGLDEVNEFRIIRSMNNKLQQDGSDESARLRRIIRAAEELFKQAGFRAVTMEAVAQEASVAKATLYAYFKNKDALYLAVCGRMARLLARTVEEALARQNLPLDERLAQAIIAKHRVVFTLIRGSPHVNELFSYKDALAANIFADLDIAILTLLAQAIAQDPQLSPGTERLARAVYFGSAELASRSATIGEMEQELSVFTAVHLAGARALAGKDLKP